jgi:nucleobase:cation symporter-1, NCS1 family
LSIQPSTYSPDIAVPADQRVFGARDLFSLWFSLGIGLMVLQTGALTGAGPGPVGCRLLAIFLGTLVGVLLLAAVGVIGSDTGLSSMAALKLSLGAKGCAACRRCSTCCN